MGEDVNPWAINGVGSSEWAADGYEGRRVAHRYQRCAGS